MYQLGNRTPSTPCVICTRERQRSLYTDVVKKRFMGEAEREPGKKRWREDSYWMPLRGGAAFSSTNTFRRLVMCQELDLVLSKCKLI